MNANALHAFSVDHIGDNGRNPPSRRPADDEKRGVPRLDTEEFRLPSRTRQPRSTRAISRGRAPPSPPRAITAVAAAWTALGTRVHVSMTFVLQCGRGTADHLDHRPLGQQGVEAAQESDEFSSRVALHAAWPSPSRTCSRTRPSPCSCGSPTNGPGAACSCQRGPARAAPGGW
jgi:hypothetical protein